MPDLDCQCDIELLLSACNHPYTVHDTDAARRARKKVDEWQEQQKICEQLIEKKGYEIVRGVEMDETTGLGFSVVAPPKGSDAPIVLAFRGTAPQHKADMEQNKKIVWQGETDKTYRDRGYNAYLKVRKEYPNNRIIITGHSLGGHLAQDVALRAMAEKNEENFLVRTFNSVGVDIKKYKAMLHLKPHLTDYFANYRLAGDLVSRFRKLVGQVFTFPMKENSPIKAHLLLSFNDALSDQVKRTSLKKEDVVSQLKEFVYGNVASYESRVHSQFFSEHRKGAKKLAFLIKSVAGIKSELDRPMPNWELIRQDANLLRQAVKLMTHNEKNSKLLQRVKDISKAVDKAYEYVYVHELEKAPFSHGAL